MLFQMREPIDDATSMEAHSCTGFDRNEYELVFSDESRVGERTFWSGEFFSSFRFFLSFFVFFSFSYLLAVVTCVPSPMCFCTPIYMYQL